MGKYQVTISENAQRRIENVFLYLEQNWSDKIRNDFKMKLLKYVEYLKQNPYMFPASQVKKDLRRCFVTKHNAMYYRVKDNEVEIITLHDTRGDPKSLKL